jgi:hypothetical protein
MLAMLINYSKAHSIILPGESRMFRSYDEPDDDEEEEEENGDENEDENDEDEDEDDGEDELQVRA